MRRTDREITDMDEIIAIIQKCDVCRLALSDHNVPYIVPMNYGYWTIVNSVDTKK